MVAACSRTRAKRWIRSSNDERNVAAVRIRSKAFLHMGSPACERISMTEPRIPRGSQCTILATLIPSETQYS